MEAVGPVWIRQAHLPKKRGILYVEVGESELSVRDETEFNRLFNKEAK